MELILNGDPQPGPITPRLIQTTIRALSGEADSFAILAREEQHYIQTAGGPTEGFVLEYRDGAEERHFVCTDADLSSEKIERAFQSYLNGDDRWKSELQWQSQAPDARTVPSRGMTLVVGLAALIVGLPLLWLIVLGSLKAIEDPPSDEVRAVLLIFGILGLFLSYVGIRMTLNKPRQDGYLLGPVFVGVVGLLIAAFGLHFMFLESCETCSGTMLQKAPAAIFLLFLAALCFRAAFRRAYPPEPDDT